MDLLNHLPIRRKMLAMTLLICGVVLCFATLALFAFQVLNFRSNFQRDASTLAEIIANNSTAALAFQDEKTAAELMSSLSAKPTVVAASLTLPDGALFAHYGQKETKEALAAFPAPGAFRYLNGHLLYTQKAQLLDDHVGTLYMRLGFRETLMGQLKFFSAVILGTLLVSILLAALLSRKLGRTITDPVLQLSRTAQKVGEEQDYSLRVHGSQRGDELGKLAESFNEMLERIQRQDAALSLSQQKMEALIHSIDGIVWERDAESLQFTFISRQSREILGYAPEDWLADPKFWQSKFDPHDAEKALTASRTPFDDNDHYSHEYRMLAADGRTVWIRESGTVLVENGRTVALRGIFQDITQQKLDAEQLDKLNRQLVDTSRHAGMAEVATGVLHNVGNVLNSVSVSATLVNDRLRRSKITNLRRATGMLRDKNGQLGDYLTNDPKGKLLPDYLNTVADQLAGEQEELAAEMRGVLQHIEHIKEIVAMQQNYAKVSGAYENLSMVDLIEDALRMNATSFDRHQIDLVREYDAKLPAVCVDRHKVLQILINLLRNAKHSMDEVEDGQKRMTIGLHATAPDEVTLTITDTGVGIPRENLKKIFNHGFTTKKHGHGFGLHSGANAAKEMGGRLSAHSDGPGTGARFTLVLPTAAASAKSTTTATLSQT